METTRFSFKTGLVAVILLAGVVVGCSGDPDVFRGSTAEAEGFASQYAARLMKNYYPNTGRLPEYTLNDWTYDTNRQQYRIDLTASWLGQSCMLCSDECKVAVQGTLTVDNDGSNPRFKVEDINSCALGHDLMGLFIGGVIEGTINSLDDTSN
ncbi:hypothetical protein [Spirosoma linguale]|uniref:Lipoprotein n=1 Tax=Spirosoma linguale (strain ATCC 33905 / DSM 74 / LMG 10896 / Claus 1) TaxID=504472 RepID=D2QUE9_SPILD|nr:hypothetical protein Slin_6474 [Spirosoma linguale DSM 74]